MGYGIHERRMENLCQSLNQVFDRRQSHNNSCRHWARDHIVKYQREYLQYLEFGQAI